MSTYDSDEALGSSISDVSMGSNTLDEIEKKTAVVIYRAEKEPAIAGFGHTLRYDEILGMVKQGNVEIPEAGIKGGLLYGMENSVSGWLNDFSKYKLAFSHPSNSDFERTDIKLWEGSEVIDEENLSGMRFDSCLVYHLYCHPFEAETPDMFLNPEELIYKAVRPENYSTEIAKIDAEIQECNKAVININALLEDDKPSDKGKEQLEKIKNRIIETGEDLEDLRGGLIDGIVPPHQSDEGMAS